MDLGLFEKVALVTAATANIGRSIAHELAAEGIAIVAVRRDEDAGAKLEKAALEKGASGFAFARAAVAEQAIDAITLPCMAGVSFTKPNDGAKAGSVLPGSIALTTRAAPAAGDARR